MTNLAEVLEVPGMIFVDIVTREISRLDIRNGFLVNMDELRWSKHCMWKKRRFIGSPHAVAASLASDQAWYSSDQIRY